MRGGPSKRRFRVAECGTEDKTDDLMTGLLINAPPRGNMLRLLIVEDNRIFREAFKKDLCAHFPSMTVEEAGNGEEALRKIRAVPPISFLWIFVYSETMAFSSPRR